MPLQEDTGAGPKTEGYLEYLRTNRDFTASAVAAAVTAIRSQAPARSLNVLDAGTGAGGALPELAKLVTESAQGHGSLLAIDLDAPALEVAQSQTEALNINKEILEFRVADLRDVARQAAKTGDRFDVIWSSDVVWPGTFENPADVVRELANALNPGGILALFTTNYYQSMFLPGHTRLERLIRTASELTWGLPDDGPTQYERLGAWMRQAGLTDVNLQVFPVTAMSDTPTARAYLEKIVWPEMRHAVTAQGRAARMQDADIARAEELLDPDSPDWVGADPDAFTIQPTILWLGKAPVETV